MNERTLAMERTGAEPDRGTMAELYARHVPAGVRLAFLLTGDRQQAEDLVHDDGQPKENRLVVIGQDGAVLSGDATASVVPTSQPPIETPPATTSPAPEPDRVDVMANGQTDLLRWRLLAAPFDGRVFSGVEIASLAGGEWTRLARVDLDPTRNVAPAHVDLPSDPYESAPSVTWGWSTLG